YARASVLKRIIVERASEAIPILTLLLRNSKNPYVREATVGLLAQIDLHAVRLRASADGQEAIAVIEQALGQGNLMPVFNKKAHRQRLWKDLSAQFLKDEWRLEIGSDLALLALAFDTFYGENLAVRYHVVQGVEIVEAPYEMRRFVTYLTEVDPQFPSWEFQYIGSPAYDQVLHPKFRVKVERYFECWKQFKNQKALIGTHVPR
ncbi:MAG: hypothetical protein MN733_42565, partial [Nitrososphaera sp.]|nr:hypothetical protein [Nitrososphaera sp.]